MSITQREVDQAASDLRDTYGGVKEDYFGLLYLEREFGLPREQAATQNAFSGNDYAENVKEENYGFLRTQAVFKKCMEAAHERWRWVQKRLK